MPFFAVYAFHGGTCIKKGRSKAALVHLQPGAKFIFPAGVNIESSLSGCDWKLKNKLQLRGNV